MLTFALQLGGADDFQTPAGENSDGLLCMTSRKVRQAFNLQASGGLVVAVGLFEHHHSGGRIKKTGAETINPTGSSSECQCQHQLSLQRAFGLTAKKTLNGTTPKIHAFFNQIA